MAGITREMVDIITRVEITREMFEKYDALLKSGTANMACGKTQSRSGLSPGEFAEILRNYPAYAVKFSKPAPKKKKRTRSKPKPKLEPILNSPVEPETSSELTEQQHAVSTGEVV